MRNPRDPKTKVLPSTTRTGKELPSFSALDSPSVVSKFATPPPTRNSNVSHVLVDSTSAIHDAYDDALLDTALPLGAFLDAQIARVAAECDDTCETDEIIEVEPAIPPGDAKTWFTYLAPGCVRSPQDMIYYFSKKYFPAHKKQAALQDIYNFVQVEEESLAQAWGRLVQLLNAFPDHPLEKNELLDIFYNGLTDASRDHLDSYVGCVFRERTVEQDEILLNNILSNDNAWTIPEIPPKPTPKKTGILFLSPEDKQEAKKSMQEKCIKSEDVKNLPPIEEIHSLDNPAQVVEVNSVRRLNESDIPFDKPASLCLDEFDNFGAKQQSFNDYVSRQLEQNACMISHISACVYRNVNDLKLLSKHASMVTTQVEQVLKAQNDFLNELNDNYVRVVTRGCRMTQEPLYPEGHSKRIEQDSQGVNTEAPSHPGNRKKKKDDKNLHASKPVVVTPENPNDVSVSDAETQFGDEHEPSDNIDRGVHDDAQPSNDKDVEMESVIDLDNPQPKNKIYDKNDFIARNLGKEREPWVQKPMPFPPKPSKKKDDEEFERFFEMIRPVFLQMCLTDMLKMSPCAKYMKDMGLMKGRYLRYIIIPLDIYAYWGIEPPQAPVPELRVEYQTPVYQWEPEELTQQWHP
ncbi:hypothetical protein ZWY2020_008240 [Hordeum vulgare]|nr:hypothetical protein ZWY2020_008240 [Hordeum vulgare]